MLTATIFNKGLGRETLVLFLLQGEAKSIL
jgi:hypothetical protein